MDVDVDVEVEVDVDVDVNRRSAVVKYPHGAYDVIYFTNMYPSYVSKHSPGIPLPSSTEFSATRSVLKKLIPIP